MTAKHRRTRGAAGTRECHLDRLLGRPVLAGNNQPVGRLEEFRVAQQDGRMVVTEYVIGVGGLMERLGVAVRMLVGSRGSSYIARWDQLDISDPDHPRLTCSRDDLRKQ